MEKDKELKKKISRVKEIMEISPKVVGGDFFVTYN